ncbi:DNA polymerase V family protein [Paenibacillus sp. Pae108]|uniref:DNA polymerase V family protein n=1 Tax=Paenibacillus sp. Pae108 TaxID=2926019 RepID=UPI002118294D|nr:DNA polymerase V family protein [Paenibacillus sp. Pae108]
MTMTILTTASMKKITSSKGTEIVLVIPSNVSLDSLKALKARDEFFIALGTSQADVMDYFEEPRKGLLVKTDASGVVESVSGAAEEEEGQMDIDQVESTNEESDGQSEADSAEDETAANENDEEDGSDDEQGDICEDDLLDDHEQEDEADDKPQMPDDEDLPY